MSVDTRIGFVVTDRELVELLGRIMKLAGLGSKRGSYNRQDPTAYEKMEGWAAFLHDPLYVETPEKPGRDGPYPAYYRLELLDCTWGTEIEIYHPTTKEIRDTRWGPKVNLGVENNGHYLDHQSGKFVRGDENQLRMFLWACISDAEWSKTEPTTYDEEGDFFDVTAVEHAAGWDASP